LEKEAEKAQAIAIAVGSENPKEDGEEVAA